MEHVIEQLELLCQEKIMLFHELLKVIQGEKMVIISADVGALWTFTSKKNELGDKINDIRCQIMDVAYDAGLLDPDSDTDYSLLKILDALPRKEIICLLNFRYTLTGIKTKISTLVHENKRYLDESLRTIEDLVHIITQNSEQTERYGRDTYLKPSRNKKAYLVYGEV